MRESEGLLYAKGRMERRRRSLLASFYREEGCRSGVPSFGLSLSSKRFRLDRRMNFACPARSSLVFIDWFNPGVEALSFSLSLTRSYTRSSALNSPLSFATNSSSAHAY